MKANKFRHEDIAAQLIAVKEKMDAVKVQLLRLSSEIPTQEDIVTGRVASDAILKLQKESGRIEEELKRLKEMAAEDLSPEDRKALNEAYDRLKEKLYKCGDYIEMLVPELLSMEQNRAMYNWQCAQIELARLQQCAKKLCKLYSKA